ncbi:hypothetical protein CL655_00320 [bacterium]|nr:hypothetical protein [bacterium]|tara:strand:- start:3517 stop:3924 length:408 start_codon:yes stop_codon:yes gene_type:complete
MLAIHDIGETKIGDVFSYTKSEADELAEVTGAREIIHPVLLPYFEEYEARESYDAKYAKAVDAISPMMHGIDLPKITLARFKLLGADLKDVREKSDHFFEWDTTMQAIYELIMEQAERTNDGREQILPTVDYDLK